MELDERLTVIFFPNSDSSNLQAFSIYDYFAPCLYDAVNNTAF